MNYSELSTAIQNYTQNYSSEFVAEIPTIVKITEDRIYNSVQIPYLKKNQTSTFAGSNKYLETPSDFLAVYSFAVIVSGQYNYMLEREVGFMGEAFPNPAATGVPRFYALFNDDTFLVAPTPDQSYSVELHYYYQPPSIVNTSTSWLGTNMENVLLYGCLSEAYSYMKGDPELMKMYSDRYMEALMRLKNLGEGFNKTDEFRRDNPRITPT
jgi:hypothetical protein